MWTTGTRICVNRVRVWHYQFVKQLPEFGDLEGLGVTGSDEILRRLLICPLESLDLVDRLRWDRFLRRNSS